MLASCPERSCRSRTAASGRERQFIRFRVPVNRAARLHGRCRLTVAPATSHSRPESSPSAKHSKRDARPRALPSSIEKIDLRLL